MALAFDNDVNDKCFTLPPEYRAVCVDAAFQAQQRAYEQMNQQQMQMQLEMARQQALGLALFGTGSALIQGMNQGFSTMQHSTDWMKNPNLAPPVGTK